MDGWCKEQREPVYTIAAGDEEADGVINFRVASRNTSEAVEEQTTEIKEHISLLTFFCRLSGQWTLNQKEKKKRLFNILQFIGLPAAAL